MEKEKKINRSIKTGSKSIYELHTEETVALAEIDKVIPESLVSIPSVDNVINAKEWVDNGSKL